MNILINYVQFTRMSDPINIFWFRRDLRLHDNAGLFHALQSSYPVLPIFIFDTNILDQLEDRTDKRVQFIYHYIQKLDKELQHLGGSILVKYGDPVAVFTDLIAKFNIKEVFLNHDFELYALERDQAVKQLLADKKIAFHSFKDQVIFENREIVKDDGEPYSVFTPYSKKWKFTLQPRHYQPWVTENHYGNFLKGISQPLPSLNSMGFNSTSLSIPPQMVDEDLMKHYARDRDFPSLDATSHIGVHLRFGTVSIRELVAKAIISSDVFLGELIWREFYQMILANFKHISRGLSFRTAYDRIEWINDEKQFEAWCEGRTGYPIVDAGMRQLNATGFMHNRLRMVVASFLTKHLLIDWRWGEAYFASKLLDYEFASNNGGWQWASGSGCDAAPYFRIFNPYTQAKKFDPKGSFIKKWVPELNSFEYPAPIVEHEFARKRCIETYKKALVNQ